MVLMNKEELEAILSEGEGFSQSEAAHAPADQSNGSVRVID